MASKMYLSHRNVTGTRPNLEVNTEILEFEVMVKGKLKMSKTFKVPVLEVESWIEWFYEKYGTNGQAYIRRASKLNFKNI